MPWLLFVVLAWILSFSVHYKHTWAAWILTLAGGEERKLASNGLKRKFLRGLVLPVGLWYIVQKQLLG